MEFTRASQVATGVLFHSSMTTSRSWWMLETLRSSTFHLRMPHRCSIGVRSETCLASPSPLPSASLARQWSLSCWNTALRPSLRREGILLCFSMSQYMLAFTVPSMNCDRLTPPQLQPLEQCWLHSYVYFPNTTSEYDAEHVHSTSLADHGEACSEWNLSSCMVLATVLQLSFRVLAIFL